MGSTTSRGNYYKRKTKEWYEARGYVVQLTEFNTARPIGRGRVLYVKKDVLGSDGISINGDEIIFWNSKYSASGRPDKEILRGRKEFARYPFPASVRLQVVVWEPRKEPRVVDVGSFTSRGQAV
jgi:hypothetical protein